MRWTVLLISAMLVACGSTPYATVGMGHKLGADYPLRPERDGGRNPTAHIEVGLEWDYGLRCGLNHWSHWLDGFPFNDKPETYKDEVMCSKTWGGK